MERCREEWMWLTQDMIDDLEESDWEHYKNKGCLCSAYDEYECACGAWYIDYEN